MKKWYSSLNTYYQVATISILASIIAFLATMFCFFIGYMDIPLGILLGSCVGILYYFLQGLTNKIEEKNHSNKLTITLFIVRLILLIGVLFLAGFLYYYLNIHVFNIFAVAGGYLITVIVLIVFMLRKGN